MSGAGSTAGNTAGGTATTAPPRRPGSRLVCALAGLAGAGALVVLAGRPWVTRVLTDVPGVHQVSASGDSAVPAASALALVAAAAAVALLVTGRLGRYLSAVVLLLAGLGTGAAVVSVLAAPADAVAAAVTAASGRSGRLAGPAAAVTAWVWLALAAAAVLVIAGAVAVVRARAWPLPGRRFESAGSARSAGVPGTTAGGAEQGPVRGAGDAIGAWDALSRGEDPTG